jgi:hypothetical protein
MASQRQNAFGVKEYLQTAPMRQIWWGELMEERRSLASQDFQEESKLPQKSEPAASPVEKALKDIRRATQ